MSAQTAAAVRIWRRRRPRTAGDAAYLLYAAALVLLIVAVPILRLAWPAATSADGIGFLVSDAAPIAASTTIALLGIGALVLGRMRGPALRPAFLLHALASSGVRRAVALRGPVVRGTAVVVAAHAAGAVLVAASLVRSGDAEVLGAVVIVVVGASSGVVVAMGWLAGQVFPRAAILVALGLGASAGAMSWWGVAPSGWSGVGLLLVMACGMTALAPWMLDRLSGAQLAEQAADWDRVTAFSFGFDFSAAASTYERGPRLGRRLRAVRVGGPRAVTFIRRDLVGQLRRPVRFIVAVGALAVGGSLVAYAVGSSIQYLVVAGAAGLVLYAATGPIAQGVQYAARVAGDYPLFGVTDRALVLLHALFPLTVVTLVLPAAGAAAAIAAMGPVAVSAIGAWGTGMLLLGVRVAASLKGPLPVALLAPVDTPAGDAGVLLRLGWALGEPVMAICCGVAVAMLAQSAVPIAVLGAWIASLIVMRWRRRR